MSATGICHVCLSAGSINSVENANIQDIYEKLTGLPSKEGKPKTACNMCLYLLKKCHRLKELALRADRVLSGLLLLGKEVALQSIDKLDRQKYNLTHGLDFSQPQIDDFPTTFEVPIVNEPLEIEDIKSIVKEEAKDDFDEYTTDVPLLDNGEEIHCPSVVGNIPDKNESDSEDDVPLKNICERKRPEKNINRVKLKRLKISNKDCREFKGDYAIEIVLTKKQQLDALRERSKSLNYQNSPYKCEMCYKGFLNVQSYDNHKEKHDKKSGEFECEICRMRYQTERQLRTHTVTSHKRQYACNQCGHRSHTAGQAREHEKWHNGHTYDCQLCGRGFTKPTTYLTHIRKRHPTEHVCDTCGCSFVGRRGLLMHKIKGHGRTDKVKLEVSEPALDRFCSDCNIQFLTIEAWKRHTIVSLKHSAANESSPQCRFCGKEFGPGGPRKHLLQHLRTLDISKTPQPVSAGAPVHCEKCGARFTNQTKLKVHVKRIHMGIKYNKNIVCEVCGKKCTTNAALKYHQRTHTGERPYVCQVCPKRFSDKNQLRIHTRTHTGERPYCCADCGMRFTQKPALNRHTRVHTGAKPYVCAYCTKTFSQSNSLKLHIKSVHLKMPNCKKNKIKSDSKDTTVVKIDENVSLETT